MYKLLFIILFSFSFGSSIKDLNNLKEYQLQNMFWCFKKARKYDLSYTMTAIMWEESQFGKYIINLSDPSAGLFHNLTGSVCCRLNLKPTSWNKSRIAQRLIQDKNFAFEQALLELKMWKSYWEVRTNKHVWSHMVSSYNGGAKGNKEYLKRIKEKVKILKIFFNKMYEKNPTFYLY